MVEMLNMSSVSFCWIYCILGTRDFLKNTNSQKEATHFKKTGNVVTLLIISSESWKSWNPEEPPAKSEHKSWTLLCAFWTCFSSSRPLQDLSNKDMKRDLYIISQVIRTGTTAATHTGGNNPGILNTVLTHFLLQVVCCWTTVRKVLLTFSTAGRTAALSSPWATCCRPSQSWKRRKTSSWRSTREFVNPHRHTHTVHN